MMVWNSECEKRRKRSRLHKKKYIQDIKLEQGCQVCGYKKQVKALVLHHKDPSLKTAEPCQFWVNGWSFPRIDKELENCMVLCRNCHGEHHVGYIDAHEFDKLRIIECETHNTYDKMKIYGEIYPKRARFKESMNDKV